MVAETRNGQHRYHCHDPLGNTIALVADNGKISDSYGYWPYGEVRVLTGSATTTPFKFCGAWGYYDDGNQLYVRARYFRQTLGRWITRDPLWPSQISYCYVGDNPITVFDPLGLKPCSRMTLEEVISSFCINGGGVPSFSVDGFASRICAECGGCSCMANVVTRLRLRVQVIARDPSDNTRFGTPCDIRGEYFCQKTFRVNVECPRTFWCELPFYRICRDAYETERSGNLDFDWRQFIMQGTIKWAVRALAVTERRCIYLGPWYC